MTLSDASAVTLPVVALLAHRFSSPSATGVGRYYIELATSLAAGRFPQRYVIASTRERENPTWLPPEMERRQVPGSRKALAAAWAIVGRPRIDGLIARPDLVHALHPWTATPTRAPLVTTIHDLMPLQHRAWYPRRESWLFGRGIAHARDHARLVIADAEHGAAQLVEEAGIERSRIRVVQLAVGDEFRTRMDAATIAEVCARHRVEPGRYLLAVGQVARRKNLSVVLRALAKLDPGLFGSRALLIAGPRGVGAQEVVTEINQLGLDGRVELAGYVPGGDLPALVGAALALVHPSRDEGFGLTPLEAMAAGVPAIASASGALPEVMGRAGILLDPTDDDAWSAAIAAVAGDPDHRAALIAAGAIHQEHFRWSRVAAQTAAVHAEALGR
ncbi:MAG: glycosyltransferase family 4 protein [Acidimicrobiales bacterium]